MKKKVENEAFEGCYGSVQTADIVEKWLLNILTQNLDRKHRSVPNIWGPAGVGKSAIVKALAGKKIHFNGKEQEIAIVDIPLAQIEEMGDVLGMPDSFIEIKKGEETKWILKDEVVIGCYIKDGWVLTGSHPKTMYNPPAWVPREERPGIILFDDGNRASMRILKGLMQLVQDYRTIGWEVPKGWTIAFTGNPDNSLYSVSSQDSAMLTRMRHITLKPDVKSWAIWAENNGIDARGISYVLRYPEMIMNGERTNLRTLTEFFRVLEEYPHPSKEDMDMLYIEAIASIDEGVARSFITFLNTEVRLVVEPMTILTNSQFALEKLEEYSRDNRHDIINVMNERLCAYLVSTSYTVDEKHIPHFQAYISSEHLPKDVSQGFMRRMLTLTDKKLTSFVRNNATIKADAMNFYKNANLINNFNNKK